jgi:hypothetical protein
MATNNAWKIQAKWFPLLYSIFILTGFVICFGIAFSLHWSKVIKNHCRVWEFMPSVSAVIGDYKPEMNVWRVAIALGNKILYKFNILGAGPRFVSSIMNYRLLFDSIPAKKTLIKVALFIDLSRIAAAGGWTYISSSEYLFEHSVCYVIYAVFSFVFMGIHTPLFFQARLKDNKLDPKQHAKAKKSYYFKLSCLWLHVIFFFVSLYFFLIEHQTHCMAGGMG